ncbi:hypothetical protein HY483_03135 [Candidatus Woesearchaeota archaeon]|nr:hypothetical protein [Candidatus Woesearchaeota archaeon]
MGVYEEPYEDDGIDVSQSDDTLFEALFLNENTARTLSGLEDRILKWRCDSVTPKAILHALYELLQKDYQKTLTTNNMTLGPEKERTMYASILEPFAKTLIKLSKTENATIGYAFLGTLIAHIEASGTNGRQWILCAPLVLEISRAVVHATKTIDTFLLYHAIDTRIPFLTDMKGEITEEFQKIQQERSKNLLSLPYILPLFLQQLKEQPEQMIQEYKICDAHGKLPKSAILKKRKD